jgi:putative membrane protein
LLGLQLALFVLGFLLTGIPAVLRRVLPCARVELAVARAAQVAFLQYSVFRTRDRTGVLVYLSELEHRVVILGDEGIHARVQDPGWSRLVVTLVAAIKAGRACDGVCALIAELGRELAQRAPILPDDTDELPNHLRGPSSP